MTKQEMLDMISKLQEQANAMPDDGGNSEETAQGKPAENTEDTKAKGDKGETPEGETAEPEVNENDEVEEGKQIEPQTNGKVTDAVKPGVSSDFQESTGATETQGVEEVLTANLDQRFATIIGEVGKMKVEMDKMKVAMSEILTRIELVQEVTDKVTTVDHDTLLSESIKLLI